MAIEETATGKQIIDATQNAVINAADNVSNMIEETAKQLSSHESFYQSPEFWVGVSFVLVVVLLFRPVSRLLDTMLRKRIDTIVQRIEDAATLKEDAQKLLVEYEKKFINAGDEAQDILNKAADEIALLKKETLEKLEAEMKIKENEAASRIEAARAKADAEITALASSLSIKTLRLALAEKLNTADQARLIDASIDKIAKIS